MPCNLLFHVHLALFACCCIRCTSQTAYYRLSLPVNLSLLRPRLSSACRTAAKGLTGSHLRDLAAVCPLVALGLCRVARHGQQRSTGHSTGSTGALYCAYRLDPAHWISCNLTLEAMVKPRGPCYRTTSHRALPARYHTRRDPFQYMTELLRPRSRMAILQYRSVV